MEQQIRFCTMPDGVRIAYATMGKGPPLVRAGHWLTHLQNDLDGLVWRHWTQELSRSHLYVRYDQRGCGLSDWEITDFSFDALVRDLETVTDTLGLDKFALLGVFQGGAVSIAYAVRHPERVSHLILYGAYAKGWNKRMSPEELEEQEARLTLMRKGWGKDNPSGRLLASAYLSDASINRIREFSELQRVSTSPENAVRIMKEFGNIDVRDLLPRITVPTITFYGRHDVVLPFEQGRELASLIPNSRFVPLEGMNGILQEEDPTWKKFLAETRSFLGVKEFPSEPREKMRETGLKGWLRGPRSK